MFTRDRAKSRRIRREVGWQIHKLLLRSCVMVLCSFILLRMYSSRLFLAALTSTINAPRIPGLNQTLRSICSYVEYISLYYATRVYYIYLLWLMLYFITAVYLLLVCFRYLIFIIIIFRYYLLNSLTELFFSLSILSNLEYFNNFYFRGTIAYLIYIYIKLHLIFWMQFALMGFITTLYIILNQRRS